MSYQCHIKKARCALHGNLKPSFLKQSIVSHCWFVCFVLPFYLRYLLVYTCVLPCLLFYALYTTLLQKLEPLQAKLTKHILRLPNCTSNKTGPLALHLPSIRKLSFLLKVVYTFWSLTQWSCLPLPRCLWHGLPCHHTSMSFCIVSVHLPAYY
jgi:hypothetical protein